MGTDHEKKMMVQLSKLQIDKVSKDQTDRFPETFKVALIVSHPNQLQAERILQLLQFLLVSRDRQLHSWFYFLLEFSFPMYSDKFEDQKILSLLALINFLVCPVFNLIFQ